MATMMQSSLCGSTAKLLATPRRTPRASARPVVARADAKFQEQLPAALLAAAVILAPAAPARADDGVDSAIDTVVGVVKATGEAIKAGIEVANTGVEVAKSTYEQVAPVVKTAVEAAAPVVQAGVKATVDIAQPAIKAAAPTLEAGLTSAQKALSSTGLDDTTKVVVGTTEKAVSTAKPLLEQFVTFLTTTDPTTLGEYALGLVAFYYLGPPALGAAFGALRGFAGEVSPAQALDSLSSGANAVLVDIRTSKEKEQAGLPDLPNNGKLIELEYVSLADRKLRGQLRNAGDLELKVTAMQIAGLKKLSKGTILYIMDRNGGQSKAVAKELARRGFGKAYVVAGGFQAWTNSKLKTKLSNTVESVEVIAPGSMFGTIGTRGSRSRSPPPTPRTLPATTTVAGRRALPSPRS